MSAAVSIASLIVTVAQAQGVNPQLALAVAQQESGLNQNKVGQAGEIGVFQLLPSTAQELGVNPYDLAGNITGGIAYLRKQLDKFGGNVAMALAAYNAGPGRVAQAVASGADWFSQIPASTQRYVSSIAGAQAVTAGPAAPSAQDVSIPGTNYVVTVVPPSPAASSDWWPLLALGGAGILYLLA